MRDRGVVLGADHLEWKADANQKQKEEAKLELNYQ